MDLIKDYKFEKLDKESIKKFLEMQNLDSNNCALLYYYPFKTLKVNLLKKIEKSIFIFSFDADKIYLFELSSLKDKRIKDSLAVDYSDVESFESDNINIELKLKKSFDSKLYFKLFNVISENNNQEELLEKLKNNISYHIMFNRRKDSHDSANIISIAETEYECRRREMQAFCIWGLSGRAAPFPQGTPEEC